MDRILIVDDEEPIRRLLRINLSDRYEIMDTGNPEQALAMAMENKPDAILLDLRMPKYSGFELCRTFHSLTFTQLVPLIVVSGEGGASTKALCKELGAAAYFQKPIDFEALRESLANVLHTARPERRSDVRVRLRVMLTLRGADVDGKPFEEASATENVSRNAFLCGCTAKLNINSLVEVRLNAKGTDFSGTARIVRTEGLDTPYPRYAFRFVAKHGEWILQ